MGGKGEARPSRGLASCRDPASCPGIISAHSSRSTSGTWPFATETGITAEPSKSHRTPHIWQTRAGTAHMRMYLDDPLVPRTPVGQAWICKFLDEGAVDEDVGELG